MERINTVIFDLDGTLLPMNTDEFMNGYNRAIAGYFKDLIDPKEFVKALWESTEATVKNLEHKKNYDVFKAEMEKRVSVDVELLYDHIYAFYDEVFHDLGTYASRSEAIVKAVRLLKQKGYRVLIATNPLFPMKANHTRIRWAGFEPDEFDYISSFEDNHYCKPHIAFYEEVLQANQIDTATALMVGNDVREDLVVKKLGVRTYLIEDHLIIRDDQPYDTDYQGNYGAFLTFVENLETL
ncbi:MAG: HAD family hydrolase [Clostridia bacterium]|nr:HAD family hydrolase [Clostridia bacterium]